MSVERSTVWPILSLSLFLVVILYSVRDTPVRSLGECRIFLGSQNFHTLSSTTVCVPPSLRINGFLKSYLSLPYGTSNVTMRGESQEEKEGESEVSREEQLLPPVKVS